MVKKLSFKLILVFMVMVVALTVTIIASYVAIDTQKQHIAITEIISEERILAEKFSSETINLAQSRMSHMYFTDINDLSKSILLTEEKFNNLLETIDSRRYTLIDGNEIKLKLGGDFEKKVVNKVEEIRDTFLKSSELSKELSSTLLDENSEKYKNLYKSFSEINPNLLMLSDELVVLCLNEATNKSKISFYTQLSSVIIAVLLILLLIFMMIVDFYNPIKKIKEAFRKMSLGKIDIKLSRDKEDEFAELFEDFNSFTSQIGLIYEFEDSILKENNLDAMLKYMYENFRKFIPFVAIGIVYSKENSLVEVRFDEKCCCTENNIEFTPWIDKVVIENINNNKVIKTPIAMNNIILGFAYFEIDKEFFKESYIDFVKLIETKLSMAFYKSLLFDDLLNIVTSSLAKMAEAKDPETGGHLKRMALYTELLAKKLSIKSKWEKEINSEFIRNIYLTAPMHDIGKVSIKDDILLKPGKLTDAEFEIMKTHVNAGAEVLKDLDKKFSGFNINYFDIAVDIALCHHEKFNGSGYPNGLKGDTIPISARICAIADVFDALSTKRPYKTAFSLEKCYRIINEGKGNHFDPEVVDVFFESKEEIEKIYYKYKEE
ncbi:HD domain-containing phosphohydrolase [Helicovermis profundi]|uniref:HD domain-containing protein n=1 Tax=Helicovermis profundi TaxID=3065157 RepID=A0AAU9E5U9_9FIRM|nr:hypothetical protein HLPR_23700 [Clostridia bacterium S502]